MFADLSPWSLYQFDRATYYCRYSGTKLGILVPLDFGEKPLPFEPALWVSTLVDVDGVPTRKYTWAVTRPVQPDQAWELAVANSKTLWDSYLQPTRIERYKAFREDYVRYLLEVPIYQEKMQAYYTQMAVFLVKLTAGDRSAMAPVRPVEPFEPTLGSY